MIDRFCSLRLPILNLKMPLSGLARFSALFLAPCFSRWVLAPLSFSARFSAASRSGFSHGPGISLVHGSISLAAILNLILLLGCARTAPSRFYLLHPQAASAGVKAEASSSSSGPVIGLGSVDLPGYLDRPQIVTRTNPYQLEISELNRWAEPLQGNIEGVLQANLAALLGTDHVLVGTQARITSLDYRVSLAIKRFDGMPGGEALLEARWTVSGKGGQAVLDAKTTTYREAVPGKTYQELVEAESRLLAALSRDIAAAIQGAKR